MASYGLDPGLQDRVPLTRSSDLVLVLNTSKGVCVETMKKVILARPSLCDFHRVPSVLQ